MSKQPFCKRPQFPCAPRKVRDITFGDELLLVSSHRISPLDLILPSGIPDKGRVLTQIAAFCFQKLGEENHLITVDVDKMACLDGIDAATKADLAGRSTLCKKSKVFPIECIVRGCLTVRNGKNIRKSGTILRNPYAGRTEGKRPWRRRFSHLPPKRKRDTMKTFRNDKLAESSERKPRRNWRPKISLFQRGAEYEPDGNHHCRRSSNGECRGRKSSFS